MILRFSYSEFFNIEVNDVKNELKYRLLTAYAILIVGNSF